MAGGEVNSPYETYCWTDRGHIWRTQMYTDRERRIWGMHVCVYSGTAFNEICRTITFKSVAFNL